MSRGIFMMASHNPVTVLHIITRLDRGGSAENVLLTASGLSPADWHVTLATGPAREPTPALEQQTVEAGVTIVTVPALQRAIQPWRDLRAFLQLVRLIRRGRYTIVHTHASKAGLLGRWAARLAGSPIIVHTPHGHVFYGYYGAALSTLFAWLERLTARVTDTIITLTARGTAEHVQYGIAPPAKFVAIHSGVDVARYQRAPRDRVAQRLALGLPPEAPVVGTVGRFVPIKGQCFVLAAAQRVLQVLPQTMFVFVGAGELGMTLQARARALHIDHAVRFLGWREDVADLLPLLDLFVLTPLNEGMGKVLVAAMAAGLPIVASRVGGIPDLVEHGTNGLLVPPASVAPLAEAILALLTDANARDRMGAQGRQRAQHYTVEAMVARIDALYRRLLQDKGIPQQVPQLH